MYFVFHGTFNKRVGNLFLFVLVANDIPKASAFQFYSLFH